MDPLIKGGLLGCVLALMVGPVFFMILNTSVKKGFLPAAMLAAGVLISDLLFVLLTYYGSSYLHFIRQHEHSVGFAGGLLILAFGLYTLTRKAVVTADALEEIDDSRTRAVDIAKGFMMNSLNPAALLFWLGVAGTMSIDLKFKGIYALLFYSGTLGVVFATDLAKAWIASRIRGVLNASWLIWMNRISGFALCLYGMYILGELFTHFQ
jgi:threonine/homoserine/homoserine lactone efflux protein